MQFKTQLAPDVYQVDRPLHHELAMAAYKESFDYRNLIAKYKETEFRRLNDVFTLVSIADPHFPSIRRPVDTFDLTSPYQAARIREACYKDLPSETRTKACLKAIDRYCQFLKLCPTIHLPGQQSLYLPELYGPIESPVNRYTIPRDNADRKPNRNFLEKSEYKLWLKFTYSQIRPDLPKAKLLKVMQFHLMCVIAGETGIRLQEILGLQPEHFTLADDTCLVVRGKGSKGSGYRKRTVPISALMKVTLTDFLRCFPRTKGEPLFQNRHRQRLSLNTAHHWIDEVIIKIDQAGLPIQIERGFGWHAFRRTSTRLYLDQSSDIRELMRQKGWAWASAASHYIGDAKQKLPANGPPLYTGKAGPND